MARIQQHNRLIRRTLLLPFNTDFRYGNRPHLRTLSCRIRLCDEPSLVTATGQRSIERFLDQQTLHKRWVNFSTLSHAYSAKN
jgi:hypothetical protein